uniref:Uncharacterized protein n=1 Tax=Poecilia formosa TaxID=48698 RepID=A0A087YS80_POEFO
LWWRENSQTGHTALCSSSQNSLGSSWCLLQTISCFAPVSVSDDPGFCLPVKESASSFREKFIPGSLEDFLLQMGQFLFPVCSQNFCRQLEQKLWLQLRDTGSLNVSEQTWQLR